MKTIVRPSLWAFFNGGPRLALPFANGGFVALASLADRPLGTPVERPQLPDVAFVIAHAEALADQRGDARAGPQRRGKAVRRGAFQ
jgi:hypothetical protein